MYYMYYIIAGHKNTLPSKQLVTTSPRSPETTQTAGLVMDDFWVWLPSGNL